MSSLICSVLLLDAFRGEAQSHIFIMTENTVIYSAEKVEEDIKADEKRM